MHDIMWLFFWGVPFVEVSHDLKMKLGRLQSFVTLEKNANCLVKWVSSGDRWNEKRMEFWHFWTFQFQLGEIVTFDKNSLKVTTAYKTTRQQLWKEHYLPYIPPLVLLLVVPVVPVPAPLRLGCCRSTSSCCPTLKNWWTLALMACRSIFTVKLTVRNFFNCLDESSKPCPYVTPWPLHAIQEGETCSEAAHFFRDPIRAEHWQKRALEIHEDWGFRTLEYGDVSPWRTPQNPVKKSQHWYNIGSFP